MTKKYTATITFTIDIVATDKETAEYLAKQATPTHFNYTTISNDGQGAANFKQIKEVEIKETNE